jgi:hypothetical protein
VPVVSRLLELSDSDEEEDDAVEYGCLEESIGPNVHTHSRRRLRRPATGVAGQESLSESESEESLFSPVLGPRRDPSSLETDAVGELDCSDGVGDDEMVRLEVDEGGDASDIDMVDVLSSDEVDRNDSSRSEWASVYLIVVISSSSGVRKATLFAAGNIGLEADVIFRFRGSGLFANIEETLCDS